MACYGGFSFSFGLHVEVCALFSVFVLFVIYFCSSGTRHIPGNVFVAGHPHIWRKTDKLLINLTYCVWFLWARSQGHSHKIYVIIERARPHISPTPYSYTQPTAQDLQLIQLDDYHPPRQPPRRILSQLVANYGPC